MKLSVMAPLFDNVTMDAEILKGLKETGVVSISVDVWWGIVEAVKDKYDFSYYDKIVSLITSVGLKWIIY